MNILAFLNSYTDGKSGGDMCFIEIFKRIPKRKLTVVTSQLGQTLCQTNQLKADYLITTNESDFRFIYWIYTIRILKGIYTAILKGTIDVIYITSDALPDVLPAVFCKIRNPKAKVIGKVFHLIPQKRIISSITQQISHFLLKIIASYLVVDNSLLKKELVTFGFISSKILVNYPAINFPYFKKIKAQKKYSATFMGRIHESKGVFDLVKIWKTVVKKMPEATLGIIGSGDKQIIHKLQELIQQSNLEKQISILGFLPDEKAYSFIKGSDVFLFPSHEEGFGMVVGEVLALQVPVVSYDLPVFTETFKPALSTIQTFDTKLFSEKVIDILNQPKKYDTVRATGKRLISKFSWETTAKKELEIIRL